MYPRVRLRWCSLLAGMIIYHVICHVDVNFLHITYILLESNEYRAPVVLPLQNLEIPCQNTCQDCGYVAEAVGDRWSRKR
jgi:hypothetical protein